MSSHPEKGSAKPALMCPSLHDAVLAALSNSVHPTPWFQSADTDAGATQTYKTHVISKFRCRNRRCSQLGWGSRKVAILIRGYAGNGYNAVVFNQRCKSCERLGGMTLDEKSYVDRVAYRLKKWAGVAMERRPFVGAAGGPEHERDLCEGCRRGYCAQAAYDQDD